MLIAQCPNCGARYKASQEMFDAYGGFFQCAKCDSKFNHYDQFSSSSENITGFSRDQHDAPVGENKVDEPNNPLNPYSKGQGLDAGSKIDDPKLPIASTHDEHNIVFNQYDGIDDEICEPRLNQQRRDLKLNPFLEVAQETKDDSIGQSLITELEHQHQQERAAVLGEEVLDAAPEYDHQQLAPALPAIEPGEADYALLHSLNILDDVEEDTKAIGSFGALWIGIKHLVHFSFWSLIILALVALLIYQFKPRLGAALQQTINNTPLFETLCKHFECASNAEKVASLEVVVSRMDLFAEPGEPLNVSLFILNRLKKAQPYPIIKLSLKNLQGLTVGQRFYKPSEYLDNAAANILAGHIGKIVLKLANPPATAVGFEVVLL